MNLQFLVFDDYMEERELLGELKQKYNELKKKNLTSRDPDSIIVEPDFPVFTLMTQEKGNPHKLKLMKVENVRYYL